MRVCGNLCDTHGACVLFSAEDITSIFFFFPFLALPRRAVWYCCRLFPFFSFYVHVVPITHVVLLRAAWGKYMFYDMECNGFCVCVMEPGVSPDRRTLECMNVSCAVYIRNNEQSSGG